MKIAVVYASVHHQNTEKLIRGIGEEIPMDIYSVEEAEKIDMSKYDMVGIASGIYFGKFHKMILDYLNEKPAMPKRAFAAVTCGDGGKKHIDSAGKILEDFGFDWCGTYVCKGFDTYGPFKLIGGINREHPNRQDIMDGIAFVRNIISGSTRPEKQNEL